MQRLSVIGCVLAVALGVQSCGSNKLFGIAEKASGDLRERMEEHAYAAIYSLSADDLKQHNLEGDFAALMAGFASSVGSCRSAALRSRNVSFTPGVAFVELVFRRECDKKNVMETDVWEIASDHCRLRSFNYSVLAPGD